MDTISMVLNSLKNKGQDNEFLIAKSGAILLCGKRYKNSEISIIHIYRFEEDTDPAEQAIIYLIKTNDGIIGYSLDAYGVYTNHGNDGFSTAIRKMNMA
ncbi:MAG: hypothetical protein ACK4EY_12425 [Flavipsychrobacter sp.]|jgi:hypothetical protein